MTIRPVRRRGQPLRSRGILQRLARRPDRRPKKRCFRLRPRPTPAVERIRAPHGWPDGRSRVERDIKVFNRPRVERGGLQAAQVLFHQGEKIPCAGNSEPRINWRKRHASSTATERLLVAPQHPVRPPQHPRQLALLARPTRSVNAHGNSPRTHLGARFNTPRTDSGTRGNALDPARCRSTVVRPQRPPRVTRAAPISVLASTPPIMAAAGQPWFAHHNARDANALRRTPKLIRPQTASLARPPFRCALRSAAGALRHRPAGARTSASPCFADPRRDRSAPRRRGPGLRPLDA